MGKLRVGVIGATGMVGQRFITLLCEHPFFTVTALAAGQRSAGKTYQEAVQGRWQMTEPIPDYAKNMTVFDATLDIDLVADAVDFVFCAVNLPKAQVKELEEAYAKKEVPVISNNSAHRGTPDVPMVIPEINAHHLGIIAQQKQRLGTERGFIAVKPNCSIQSYVPALTPLLLCGIESVAVTTYQAISGAGKTFESMPEIIDNIIPFISGEEEKSEQEPMKIWGSVGEHGIIPATSPVISAQCLRVPVTDGHTAAVFVKFKNKPTKEEILSLWQSHAGLKKLSMLPSAPKQMLYYMEEDNRPQPKLDRDKDAGMAITLGRLREDTLFDYKFVGLSHNTLRGAAGGAVLIAELLYMEGYISAKVDK